MRRAEPSGTGWRGRRRRPPWRIECARGCLRRSTEGVRMPLTQVQLSAALADRAEISRADAKRALGALEEVVLEELGNAQKVRIGGLVQLTVRVKPACMRRGRVASGRSGGRRGP